VWGRADDGGKSGRRAVDELHAALPHDRIVGSTEPDLAGFQVHFFSGQVEVGIIQVAQGLLDFKGEESGHAGIQQGPQVGQMVAALDMGRQQFAGELQGLFHIFEGFDFDTGERIDHRQK
jgi:hypothetical protein